MKAAAGIGFDTTEEIQGAAREIECLVEEVIQAFRQRVCRKLRALMVESVGPYSDADIDRTLREVAEDVLRGGVP